MAVRRPTISDVAEAAGVSRTTVSHALNGKGRVDEGTRERVRAAAEQLGYRASPTAAGLRLGRTMTIGMMLPSGGIPPDGREVLIERDLFGVEFYLDVAVSAARTAFGKQHALTLLPDMLTADDLRQFPLDGVIVNDPQIGDPRIAAIETLGLPFVTIERMLDRPGHRRWVATDTISATRAVLHHLADAGAERIALVSGDLPWAWYQDTEDAYRSWCDQRGVAPHVVSLTLTQFRDHGAAATVDELLAGPTPPDAVFTGPDMYARALAQELDLRGIRLGDDLLLACGVDSAHVRAHHPPITAIDLFPRGQAEAAVELLLEADAPGPRLLPSQLNVRASTCPGA